MVRDAGVTEDHSRARPDDHARGWRIKCASSCSHSLDRHVARYGRWPYQGRSLLKEFKKARGKRSLFLPLTWVWKFVRHARDRERPPAKNKAPSPTARLGPLLLLRAVRLVLSRPDAPLAQAAVRLPRPELRPSARSARATSSGSSRTGRCRLCPREPHAPSMRVSRRSRS